LKVDESKFRTEIAFSSARLAFVLRVVASARSTLDSVLHFAAAYPAHAASRATTDSRTASAIHSLP
jgi:hypothetical protein